MRSFLVLLILLQATFPVFVLADDAIHVAAIFAVSGPASPSNIQSLTGVRLGVETVNQNGGVLGRRLELRVYDNLSTAIGSKLAAEEAIDKGAVAILGSDWSTHSLAVAKIAQERGVPMITNISTNPRLTRIGDHVFRVCFDDAFQGYVMARFAHQDLKAATAAVFVDLTSDFSMDLARRFSEVFTRLGGTVVAEQHYKSDWSDFKSIVLPLRELDPDVLFLPGYQETGLIAKQCREAGLRAIPLGGDGWTPQNFLQQWGAEIPQGYFCAHWSPELDTPESRDFVRKYGEMYKLNSQTALGYDAARLLADAMRRAGTAEPGALREALAETSSFKGVTGDIRFDEHGDSIKKALIMSLSHGEIHFVKTVPPAENLAEEP